MAYREPAIGNPTQATAVVFRGAHGVTHRQNWTAGVSPMRFLGGTGDAEVDEGGIRAVRVSGVLTSNGFDWSILLLLAMVETVLIGMLLYERRVRRGTRRLLEERLRLERLVGEVLVEFTNLPKVEIESALRGALERIGRTLAADRTSVWALSRDGRTFRRVCVWVPSGLEVPPEELDMAEATAWLDEGMRKGEVLRASVTPWRVGAAGSSLILPLGERGSMIGWFSIAAKRSSQNWPDEMVTGLRMVADTFATALMLRRSALAVKESEALSSAVLASMSSNVAILDRQGTIVRVNDAWRRFARDCGVADERNAFVGENYLAVCRAAAADGILTAGRIVRLVEAVLTDRESGFSLEHVCSSGGADVWLELRVEPLVRAEGGAVVTYTDITSRKVAEHEALSRLQVLAQVTRAITLGALSGSLAHELNQPLTAILSNAQAALRFLAVQPPRLSAVSDILHDIASDTRRASEVIRGMRRLLRAGEPEYVTLDINAVITDALRLVADDAVIRRARVDLALDPSVPYVRANAIQLQQVIMNLLMNALDAVESVPVEERRLGVDTTRTPEGRVEVRVVDRGPGASQEALDQVFEPFFTTKSGGLGLGLYIARSIIEAHGGVIRALKNPDCGLTMLISLPSVAAAPLEARLPRATGTPGRAPLLPAP